MIPADPSELGLTINEWRPGQREAAQFLEDDDSYAKILVAPTGSGKTAIKWAPAISRSLHTFGLTSTKFLQGQDLKTYPAVNILKGQNSYKCIVDPIFRVDEARCHAGWSCPVKHTNCTYYVNRDKLVNGHSSLNYAYYITARRYVAKFPVPQFLIMDEAHNIEREMMHSTSIFIANSTCGKLSLPLPPRTVTGARQWATVNHRPIYQTMQTYVDMKAAGLELTRKQLTRYRLLKGMENQMALLLAIQDEQNWVVESTEGGLDLRPITIGPFTSILWAGIPKLAFLSATIPNVRYFAESLGLPDWTSQELPSLFDPKRRPIIIDPLSGPMNFQTEGPDTPIWKEMVDHIDWIYDKFPDSKGIVHTQSYGRASYIYMNSRHRERMVQPASALAKEFILRRWSKDQSPRILLSPSAWEGIDLEYEQNAVQVIAKMSHPNRSSPQSVARMRVDDRFAPNTTALHFVQAAGRAMRHADDQGITFVLDPFIKFFIKKHGDFIPRHIHDSFVWR